MALPGFTNNWYESYARFSWDLYSHDFRCKANYELVAANGERGPIKIKALVNDDWFINRLFHRDTLPSFHKHLCEEKRRRRIPGQVYAIGQCKLDKDPQIHLIQEQTDICSAPNFGVISP